MPKFSLSKGRKLVQNHQIVSMHFDVGLDNGAKIINDEENPYQLFYFILFYDWACGGDIKSAGKTIFFSSKVWLQNCPKWGQDSSCIPQYLGLLR